MAYTPGPWTWRYSDSFHLHIVDAPTCIALATGLSEDDARLVAAAPEMLAALRGLVELVNDAAGGAVWKERAWTAIAKAEGGYETKGLF